MTEKDKHNGEGVIGVADGGRVAEQVGDLLIQAASAEVLNEEDFQPDTPVTVVIPESDFWRQEADEIQTEFRFLEGDLSPILTDSPFAGIRFELKEFKDHPVVYLEEVAKKGGRIFTTESDSHFIVHSEESLQYKKEYTASQG